MEGRTTEGKDADILRLLDEGRAGGNCDAAFEVLLDRYEKKVYRLAYSMMRNESEAADAAQEAFVRAWRGLPKFEGRAALSTWLYAVTRNVCLSHLKSRATRATDTLDEAAPVADSRVPRASAGMEAEEARALLARLPENYRHVLTLFYLEEKSYEEVAAMAGLPMGTVKTHLHRARKELARMAGTKEPPHAMP